MKIYAKVEGQHYVFERPEVDRRGFAIGSSAKYCPLCLRGWVHMTCVHNEGTPSIKLDGYHSVAGQVCPRCARQAYYRPDCVPGSLLEEPQTNCQTVDDDLLDYLPLDLLRREFDLHYEFLYASNTVRPSTIPSQEPSRNAAEQPNSSTNYSTTTSSHVWQG